MTSTNRLNKQKEVEKLAKELHEAKSVSLIDFTGMDIKAQNDLKKKLKEVKAKMIVAKNTIIKLSGKEAKFPSEVLEDSVLSGQTAIVMGTDDPVAPIQIIGKVEGEVAKFKVGILDGLFQDKNAMIAISKLPSKDVLVGQTVGAIAGPMYALISNLQANIQELLGTLAAKVG